MISEGKFNRSFYYRIRVSEVREALKRMENHKSIKANQILEIHLELLVLKRKLNCSIR